MQRNDLLRYHPERYTGPVEEPSKMTNRNLMHDIKI